MLPEGNARSETATSADLAKQRIVGRLRYPGGGTIEFSGDGKYKSRTQDGFEDNGTSDFPQSNQGNLFVMKSSKLRSKTGIELVFVTPGLAKMTYVDYPPTDGPAEHLGTWPPAHFLVCGDDQGEYSEEIVQLAERLQQVLESNSRPPIQFVSPDADGSNPWLVPPPDQSAK